MSDFSSYINQYFQGAPPEFKNAMVNELATQDSDAAADVAALTAMPRTAVVYQPGGVAAENVYTSWSAAVAAITAIQGPKYLAFDDSFQFPILLPVGTWDMKDVTWMSAFPTFRRIFPFTVEVNLPEGCIITRLRRVDGALMLRGTATSTSNIKDFGDTTTSNTLELDNFPKLVSTGAAPLIEIQSGVFAFLSLQSVGIQSTLPVVRVLAGGTLVVVSRWDNNQINDNVISSEVGSTVTVTYNSTSTALGQQSLILGAYNVVANGRATMRINPRPAFNETTSATVGVASPIAISLSVNDTARLAPAAGVPITQTLPVITAASRNAGGQYVRIENEGADVVRVLPAGAETINLLTAAQLAVANTPFVIPPGCAATFQANGRTNWMVVSTHGTEPGPFFLPGHLSPAALAAGPTQDYTPVDATSLVGLNFASTLRVTANAGGSSIGGLVGGLAGKMVTVHNVGGGVLTINDEDAGSTAANRFALTAPVVLAIDGSAEFRYDGVSSRWRLVSMANPFAPSSAYTPTNVIADRSYDADATTTDELADVLGTLIADLQAKGILG